MATASALFTQALAQFSVWLHGPDGQATWMAHAHKIPDGHPQDVVQVFLQELPGWLVDLHFERLSRALSAVHLPVARRHWQVLEAAAQFPALQQAADLELLRERLCQRFLAEPLLQAGPHEREEVLAIAERLLQVDPSNTPARVFALRGYVLDLQLGLERLGRGRTRRDDLLPRAALPPPVSRRLRGSLRQHSRRLRRHVTVLSRTPQRTQPEVADGYLVLCRYYVGIQEHEVAVRMAQRARRLRPADPHIRGLVRQLRRPRRS